MGVLAGAAVPDPRALVGEVLERSPWPRSRLHGEDHWKRVAVAGLDVLDGEPRADPIVVFLFALFHDSMRLSDGRDPEHGTRAAALARELRGELHGLPDAEVDLLGFALAEHDNGRTSDEPTVGVCWDADRLNLWRVGIRPDPRLLSTPAGRHPRRITWAEELQRESFSWWAICGWFGLL